MERGLNTDKLHFALIYCRFVQMAGKGEISLDELDVLKDEILNGMSEEEFIQTRNQNLEKLKEYYLAYDEKYGNAKDEEKKMADAWMLKGTERNDTKAVSKLYWEILQVLEQNNMVIEHMDIVAEEDHDTLTPSETDKEYWICPKCGAKHADAVKFCPNDGTPKPEPEDGWTCPVCGTRHADTVKFCPNDGTKNPGIVPAVSVPSEWTCPICGTKYADTVKFCPNDGAKSPL